MTNATESLKIEGRPGGPLMTMAYWLIDEATGLWAMVDPTYEVLDVWADRLEGAPPPSAIYITHPHFDHAAGLADLRRLYPDAPVWVHPIGREMLESGEKNGAIWAGLPYPPSSATHFFQEGDTVRLGQSEIRILDTPGHCPGSVVLLCGGQLIAGDVIFHGSVGRWDLPGADYETLAASIREKVMTLPDATVIYPGHGPATTVGEERRYNAIVQKMLRGERY